MNAEEKAIYEEYKFSRDNIQLINAHIISATLNKRADVWEGDIVNNLNLSRKVELDNSGNMNAYLKADIEFESKEDSIIVGEISIVCKGHFDCNPSIEINELKRLVELQAAPQLLPYLRSAVSNLSNLMAVPTIILPTMDIIKTIKMNSDLEE